MYNILIVDDEEIICSSLKARIQMLGGEGLNNIYEAYNGKEAIGLAEKVKLDIVITDIKMPEMNGIELIREMTRKNLARQFLVISGYDDYEYVREAFKCGIVDYLLKPVSMKDLKEKLEGIFNALKQKGGEQADNNSDTNQATEDKRSLSTVVDIAKKYIQENDIRRINLAVISNEVSMNYTYFSELFREETGVTFSRYLMDVKMSKAKDLLMDPCKKVHHIAYELGYENPKHFSRAFKKYFGISPTDYRNKME